MIYKGSIHRANGGKMEKNLMLVSEISTHITGVYNILRCSNIDVVHTENEYDAKAGLAAHSPAFILLDFYIKGVKSLLQEIIPYAKVW